MPYAGSAGFLRERGNWTAIIFGADASRPSVEYIRRGILQRFLADNGFCQALSSEYLDVTIESECLNFANFVELERNPLLG